MLKQDKHILPDTLNQYGPPIVSVSVNNSNDNQTCGGGSGCCPCPPPTPGGGGGGAYLTQIYQSRQGDGGVQVQRKGSAAVVSHKVYDTVEMEADYSDFVVSDIQVVNGHVVAIERTLFGDVIDSKVQEATEPLDERLSTVESEVAEIETDFEPRVEEVFDRVLPEALRADVPVIMKSHLKEQLVDKEDNILFNALTESTEHDSNIFANAFDTVVSGIISGGAPLPAGE